MHFSNLGQQLITKSGGFGDFLELDVEGLVAVRFRVALNFLDQRFLRNESQVGGVGVIAKFDKALVVGFVETEEMKGEFAFLILEIRELLEGAFDVFVEAWCVFVEL